MLSHDEKEELAREGFWNYQKNHGVDNWSKRKLDATSSYFIRTDKKKQEHRLAKNILSVYGGYGGRTYIWAGWYSRIEHVAVLVDRLHEQAMKYYEDVWRPTLLKALEKGKTEHGSKTREVFYFLKGKFFVFSIENREAKDWGLSWSPFNSCDIDPSIIQEPDWEKKLDHFVDNEEALDLLDKLQKYDGKCSRHSKAQDILNILLNKKLDAISKAYKAGDIIEFTLGKKTRRYQKKNDFDRGEDFGRWQLISEKPINQVDICSVIPENLY